VCQVLIWVYIPCTFAREGLEFWDNVPFWVINLIIKCRIRSSTSPYGYRYVSFPNHLYLLSDQLLHLFLGYALMIRHSRSILIGAVYLFIRPSSTCTQSFFYFIIISPIMKACMDCIILNISSFYFLSSFFFLLYYNLLFLQS
jgi:hypothetical protein